MSGLTIKQENFCLAYVETSNASEAYRHVYDCTKMKEATINRAAKELMDNPKITARLAELRKAAAEATQLTLTTHLSKLAELRDKAAGAQQFSAAITAEISRGKAGGLYVDRAELTGKDGGAIAVEQVSITTSRLQALRARLRENQTKG